MKTRDLLNAEAVLNKIAISESLPFALAIKLTPFFKRSAEILQTFREHQNKMVKKYGKKDEKTGQITVPEANREEFEKIMNEMADAKIDVKIIKVSTKEFGPNFNLSIKDLSQISWLLSDMK